MADNCCSMCGGNVASKNYTKLVDPPPRLYGTILGDAPPQSHNGRSNKSQMPAIQLCLPTGGGSSSPSPPAYRPGQQPSIIQVPCDPVRPCPKFVCEPCPPPPPTKVWLLKSSPVPQKSFAIAQPPPCVPLSNSPIVIPCQPYC